MKPRSHGQYGREMNIQTLNALDLNGDPGKFGRMFPDLDPLIVPDADLLELAQAMKDDDARSIGGDNPNVPAGYTYLGQFVDHDITLDTTPLAEVAVDPNATRNFRTPALDLDSLYGEGPGVSPHLYQRSLAAPHAITNKFLIGRAVASPDAEGGTIGTVTSGLPSPTLGHPIACAYVPAEIGAPGTEVTVDIRGRRESMTVTKLPFYTRQERA